MGGANLITIPENHESIIEPLMQLGIDYRDIEALLHRLSPIRNRTIIDASSACMAVLGIHIDRLKLSTFQSIPY